ncbi:hypothetical protein LJC08_01860 [Methanimicrococcus sp. OttesenSCG-928-J09]|nr:hypothetical protein [Methanimicrococcus sp. OttesenSCG-928-J09]
MDKMFLLFFLILLNLCGSRAWTAVNANCKAAAVVGTGKVAAANGNSKAAANEKMWR